VSLQENKEHPMEEEKDPAVVIVKMESDIKRVTYQCANPNCKEQDITAPGGKRITRDVLKVAEGEGTPVAVNCWKCGGGRKMSMEQQVQARKAGQNREAGMFPLPGADLQAVQ
jgi:hypothetical protein